MIASSRCHIIAAQWTAGAESLPEGQAKLKSERIARAWAALAVSAAIEEAETSRRRGGH